MIAASLLKRTGPATAVTLAVLSAAAARVEAAPYLQTNLVSDLPGLAAVTDPELLNPWGVALSATSPFWISNQGANTSTLYAVTGAIGVSKVDINPPTGFVSIPTTGGGPQGPTGQVNNANAASFLVGAGGNGGPAHFIFANLNGTISAWDAGAHAFTQVTTPGAVYTGLAINRAQTRLYAANDAGGGGVNVFDSAFAPVSLGPHAFANPFATLVPFNVQDIGGKVYVTYAPAGRASQIAATPGMGAVAVFDENGTFLKTLIDGSRLAAPWGVALAPAGFGTFANDLLVGNFSYAASAINAFDPANGAFIGAIPIDVGSGDTAGGLWDLVFGNGGKGGSPNVLYFTDGINGEKDGLFAALSVPEPSGLAIFAAALGALAVCRNACRRRR